MTRTHPRVFTPIAALVAVLLTATPAGAAGELGAPAITGTAVAGIAGEASGSAIAVGSDTSGMLVQRVAPDGTLQPPFAAGPGAGVAVAIRSDGYILVAGSDNGASFVRRFAPDGLLDTSFGSAGTVGLPQISARAIAIGANDAILIGGSVRASDGAERAAILKLTAAGGADPTFGSGGLGVYDVGRNSVANAITVLPSGRVVFAGQRAPNLQATSAIVGRTTPAGALDTGFATAGVYQLPAAGAFAAFDAVTRDAEGRIVAGGTEIIDSGTWATFSRLTPAGVSDGAFGNAGILRARASVNTTGLTTVGVRGLVTAGNNEIVGAGAYQDSGQRSAGVWAISPAGGFDQAVGAGGVALTPPTSSDATEATSIGATPDGTLFVGGTNTNFSRPSAGTVTRVNGFGALPPPSTVADGGAVTSPGAAAKAPAKVAVSRAAIAGRKLVVSGSITGRAEGRLSVVFRNNGTRSSFSVRLKRTPATQAFHLERALSQRARRRGRGTVTIAYPGSPTVRSETVRLAADRLRSGLTTDTKPTIDQSGFLVVTGKVSRRASGFVAVRLAYVDARRQVVSLVFRGRIAKGRWRVEAKLPDAAALAGGTLSISYPGLAAKHLRGEQLARAVAGNPGALAAVRSVRNG